MNRIETLVFVQSVQRGDMIRQRLEMNRQVQRVLETTVVARTVPKLKVLRYEDVETYSGLRVHALNKEMQR